MFVRLSLGLAGFSITTLLGPLSQGLRPSSFCGSSRCLGCLSGLFFFKASWKDWDGFYNAASGNYSMYSIYFGFRAGLNLTGLDSARDSGGCSGATSSGFGCFYPEDLNLSIFFRVAG